MTASLPEVRHDSQEYIKCLGNEDWASVIIFSGHGTSKLIAGPTQCTTEGQTLLRRAIEREVRPIGTTVFSEPLELTFDTVKRLVGEDTVHNAVLFTDGCAVPTQWGVELEQQKAITIAHKLQHVGAVVSVIGYGFYYDHRFLTELMDAAGHSGVYRHISEIDDFGPAIEAIRAVFIDTTLIDVDLTFTPNAGRVLRVFKTTPELFMISNSGKVSARGLYQGKATFFVELSQPCKSVIVEGVVGKESIHETLGAASLSDESVTNFVRALGAYAFLNGDRETASELLAMTGDEGLAEKAASSYTDREQREMADLSRSFFREHKFIGTGLKPTGPSHCVLNVMRTLIEDQRNVVFLGKNGYKRSGELTHDPRVIHPPMRTLKVVGYRSHESRFNFSVLCVKDVKVLPEHGDGAPVDRKLWRTYNVILDANLWTSELEAVVSEETFNLLQDAGVISKVESYRPTKIYTINLRNLKMISGNWANPSTLGLVELLREEAELEAEQTALNAQRKATAPVGQVAEDEIYREQAAKVDAPMESYRARCAEVRLMKYKPQAYDCSKMTYEEADLRVKEVRQRLIVVRYVIRAITFAMEMTGSKAIPWDHGKVTQRGEYPKLEQTALYRGAQLKRVSWEEQFVCS